MQERVATRALFDWWLRPFDELLERVARLREAADEQVQAIQDLLAQREARLADGPASPEPTHDPGEPRLSLPEIDLRVRSALIRDGSAGPIRQAMAELVSHLGLHHQLDRSSEAAYEVVAAAERLLALVRGEGWVFARADIVASGHEMNDTLEIYRRDLDEAAREFEQRCDQLTLRVRQQLRRYEFSKYLYLLLLFGGPLLGLWAGLQQGYGRGPTPIPQRYVPAQVARTLAALGEDQRLTEADGTIVAEPWSAGSPALRLSALGLEMAEDLDWNEQLCARIDESLSGTPRTVLSQACAETRAASARAQETALRVAREVEQQGRLHRRLVEQALASLPPTPGSASGTPASAAPAPASLPTGSGSQAGGGAQ